MKNQVQEKKNQQRILINIITIILIFSVFLIEFIKPFITTDMTPVEVIESISFIDFLKGTVTVVTAVIIRSVLYKYAIQKETELPEYVDLESTIHEHHIKIINDKKMNELEEFNKKVNIQEGLQAYKFKCSMKIQALNTKIKVNNPQIKLTDKRNYWQSQLDLIEKYQECKTNKERNKLYRIGFDAENLPCRYPKVNTQNLFNNNSTYSFTTKSYDDHSDKIFLGSTAISLILSALFGMVLGTLALDGAPINEVLWDATISFLILVTNGATGYWLGTKLVKGIKKPALELRHQHLIKFEISQGEDECKKLKEE